MRTGTTMPGLPNPTALKIQSASEPRPMRSRTIPTYPSRRTQGSTAYTWTTKLIQNGITKSETRRPIRNHTAETEASSSPFDDAFVEPSRAMRRKNALVSVGVAMTHTDMRLNQRGLYSFTRTSAPTSRGRSHRFQSSGARRFGYSRGSARMSYPFAKGVRRSKQALFGVG